MWFSKSVALLVAVYAGFFEANGQFDQLLHKTHAQRFPDFNRTVMVESFTVSSADSSSALANLKSVEKLAVANGDNDLLLETKIARARYNHQAAYWGKLSYEQVLRQILAVRAEAVNLNATWAEARIESILAAHYFNMQKYEAAFVRLNTVYNLIKDIPPNEYPDRKNTFCTFANHYYNFRDYRSAIFYLQQALVDSVRHPWDEFHIQCYNTMGLCYRELDKLDSSSYFFRQTIREAVKENSHIWVAIAGGNLGENHFLRREFELAKPLLLQDAANALTISDWGLAANALTILAEISLEEGKTADAGKLITQAREYAYRSGDFKRLKKLYPTLSKYYITTGEAERAKTFVDSAIIVRDSLDRAFNSLVSTRAAQKVELERHTLAMQEMKSQQEIKTLQRNALLIIVLLSLVMAYLIINNQRKKYSRKQAELARAREELQHATKELEIFTSSIADKNKLIEDLKLQIADPDSDALLELQKSTILTDEQWSDFRNLFARVHRGYIQRLSDKLPELSPAETRFVMLSKLKLSPREMASMLGVGADTIRQHRSRIRKKLNLKEDESLEELIESI